MQGDKLRGIVLVRTATQARREGIMELCVHRLDQRRCATLVTRADRVRYVVDGVGVKFLIPHDLAHLAIEGALQLERGFWGTIAAGGVFGSMRHVDGRRQPHSDARSRSVLKANRGWVVEAEGLVALFNSAFEAGMNPDARELARDLSEFAWTPPSGEPRAFGKTEIGAAWTAWHHMRSLWEALPVGGQLNFRWADERAGMGKARQRRGEIRSLVMDVAV